MATTLENIPDHHIWMQCACSHSALVAVRKLLEAGYARSTDVNRLREAARCSRCGTRGRVQDLRIVWVGASERAMSSGHAIPDSVDTTAWSRDQWRST